MHLSLVDTPGIWYLPLQYRMGNWAPEAGDTLVSWEPPPATALRWLLSSLLLPTQPHSPAPQACQLWECDGGCDPAKPTAPPNPTLDDLVGTGVLSFATSYTQGFTAQMDMFRPGSTAATANIQLDCSDCLGLHLAGWSNPNAYVAPAVMPVNGTFGASPAPVPPPSPSPSPAVASPPPAMPPPTPVVASPPASGSPAPAPGPVGSRRPCHLACTSPTTPCQPCLAGPASPELQRSARQRQPRPIQPSDQLAATAQGVSGSRVSAYP